MKRVSHKFKAHNTHMQDISYNIFIISGIFQGFKYWKNTLWIFTLIDCKAYRCWFFTKYLFLVQLITNEITFCEIGIYFHPIYFDVEYRIFFPTSNFNGFLYQNQIDKSIRKVFDLIIPLTQRCMYPANWKEPFNLAKVDFVIALRLWLLVPVLSSYFHFTILNHAQSIV